MGFGFSWAKNIGKAFQGLGIGAAAVATQFGGQYVVENYAGALLAGGVPSFAVALASPYVTPILVGAFAAAVNYLKNR